MRLSSLRLRLVGGGVAAILLALALAGVGLTYLFQRHLQRSLSEDLDVHLRQLIGGLDVGADGRLSLGRMPADPRFADPLSGLYWQVAAEGQLLRSRSLWDARIEAPGDRLEPGELHRHVAVGPGQRRLLIAERAVSLSGPAGRIPVRILVAADFGRVESAASAFAWELGLALATLAVVLSLATALQVALGLRPLDRLRRAVADVRGGGAARLPIAVPREVKPLTEEINALLDARDREIERSRGSAADLAHGLKTPLAVLAGEVTRLRKLGQDAVARDIEEVGDAMSRHVDRELARARARASGASRMHGNRSVGVLSLARSLVAMLAKVGDQRTVHFHVEVPQDFTVPLDRDDLAEVLGNLLENASRHARSQVRIRASLSGGVPLIAVDDDGEGIAPEARAAMLARGARLDTGGSGAGLGLAIVQDVLEAYGWRLDLARSDLGGLSARVVGTGLSAACPPLPGRRAV